MKTSELSGAALDWAAGLAQGFTMNPKLKSSAWISYSSDWAQGGLIIEREKIAITGTNFPWWECDDGWYAHIGDCYSHGATPLEAAMRCYVASKLGDEIGLPEELMINA